MKRVLRFLNYLLNKKKTLNSSYFDRDYYLRNNPDVAESNMDPLKHFMLYGGIEGRNPGPSFNCNSYLGDYEDVKESGINPLLHYIKYGQKEGRILDKKFKLYPLIQREIFLEQKARALNEFLSNKEKLSFVCFEPEISIILILYNKAELTLACLQSIKKNSNLKLELIIVDNNSNDETHELLKKIEVSKVIINERNEHFLTACNQALQYVSTPNVLFLNNDTEIQCNALESALKSLNQKNEIGAVGAKLILPEGYLQEAGSVIWQDGTCLGYGRGHSPFLPEYNFKRIVDYCSGAFLLTKTELIKQHKGFDTKFLPAYYEETDYCLWLQENGYNVVYDPNVIVRHFEFASSNKNEALQIQNINSKIFRKKHSNQLKLHFKTYTSNILEARFAASQKDKLKILYIEDKIPHPSFGAGYPRSYSIIKTLEELGHMITIYPNTSPFIENIEEIYQSISPFTEIASEYGIEKFDQFLESRKKYYDIIWITRPHNMRSLKDSLRKHKNNYKIIYDAEAIFSEREIGQRKLSRESKDVIKNDQMIEKEFILCEIADLIFTVSEKDSDKFINFGYDNVKVLGHMLNIQTGKSVFKHRKDLLFVGNLDVENSPNVDSIKWFINKVLPLVKKKIPGIQFHIIGSCNANSLDRLNRKGVIFHGKVEYLKTFYDNCRIFVAPTRFAAGIPYKVHEAASFGIPVVASELLVNQLGWKNNYHLISSKIDKICFAENVVRLYRNESLWNIIQINALNTIKDEFSQDKFKEIIFETLTNILAK
ncbi:MAG: glycosyltransferase [Candidatus Cloacimonetes bacterium]|nr:glycosyltransferase [Candidatus Cloacimonadota bacterium]